MKFCQDGNDESVRVILKRVLDPEIKGHGLIEAVNRKFSRTISWILKDEIPLKFKNKALHNAVRQKEARLKIVILLVNSGAYLHKKSISNKMLSRNPEVWEFFHDLKSH